MEETETPETSGAVEKPSVESAAQVDLLGMTTTTTSPSPAPADGVPTQDLLDFGIASDPVKPSSAVTANGHGNDLLNMNGNHNQKSTDEPKATVPTSEGGLLLDVPETRTAESKTTDPFASAGAPDPFVATPAVDPFAAPPPVSQGQPTSEDPFLVSPSPVVGPTTEEAAVGPSGKENSVEAENAEVAPGRQQEPLESEKKQPSTESSTPDAPASTPSEGQVEPDSSEPPIVTGDTVSPNASEPSALPESKETAASPVETPPPVDEVQVAAVMGIPRYVLERFSQDYPIDGRSLDECIRQEPVDFHKHIVRSVLQTYDAKRAGLVDKLFIKYRGSEDKIVQKMIQKYKIRPEEKNSSPPATSDKNATTGDTNDGLATKSEEAALNATAAIQADDANTVARKDPSTVDEKRSGVNTEGANIPATETPTLEAASSTQAPDAGSNAQIADVSKAASKTESAPVEPVVATDLAQEAEEAAEPQTEPGANPDVPESSEETASEQVEEEGPTITTAQGSTNNDTESHAATGAEPALVALPPRSIASRAASVPSTSARDGDQEEALQRPGMDRAQSVPVVKTPPKPTFDESIVMDLQNALEAQVTLRNQAEERAVFAESRVMELEGVVSERDQLQKDLEKTRANLVSMTSDRSSLELELTKLRDVRDEFERKETVLSNRLNAAKKKEGVKGNEAKRLEERVKALETVLDATKKELEGTSKSKASVERELESKTKDYESRLKQAEHSLAEERRLNEDRKKKMKSFVESKQEELRDTKAQGDELTLELSQTNRSLREHHNRWKQLHAQWVQSQTRNRELQRDLNKLKKEQDTIQRKGGKLEIQMARSAKESEEHKNKRLTAKNELMTVLQTLETEREVATKLQDSIKFTFTPKALSQQQLLKESLRDFERELVQLSTRVNRPLPPAPERPELFALVEDDDPEAATDEAHQTPQSRSQLDTTHLLKNLEDETQRVSQCIMALTNSIERMHVVLAGAGERNCTSVLAELFAGNAVATTDETTSMTGNRPTPLGRRYGQVPQD